MMRSNGKTKSEILEIAALTHVDARKQKQQLVYCIEEEDIVFTFRDLANGGGVEILSNINLQEHVKTEQEPNGTIEEYENPASKRSSPSTSEESFRHQKKTLFEHFRQKQWRKRSYSKSIATDGKSFRGSVYYGVEPDWAIEEHQREAKRYKVKR